VGDTKRPLMFLIVAGVINAVLNMFLVIAFHMGVAGVAIATVISQMISCLLVLRCLYKTDSSYQLRFSRLCMKKFYLAQIFQVGIPAGIQSTVINFSNALLQSSVNSFGSTAMAGYTAANNVLGFLYASVNAVTQACMSFTSQNYGVGKYKRMDRVLLNCGILSFIIAFVLAIVVMIVAISKFKVHPFLSIMSVSLILALLAGIPLGDIANVIGAGFSGTFSSIGIVIILGALIGTVLEQTGAALKLADMVVKLVGQKNPELAIELMGWVVSIPVFCDSGFVILDPIRRAMVRRTKTSSVAMTVALSAGLYISHVFIPPTPGPIAAANTLGIGDNLLLVMGLGAAASILPLIAGLLFAKYIGKKVQSADETTDSAENVKTYEELVASYGKLPGGFNALAPIIVPIILMALGSIASMAGWTGIAFDLFNFLGKPIIALGVGTICAVIQLATTKKLDKFYDMTNDTLKVTGPILFVTAAGGVLGKVIATSDMVNFITEHATVLGAVGIFFPFLLAAILKSAQGSSTVAITTTAGIVAPLLGAMGFTSPAEIALVVMAIGAGAMTVSHANDSYFWVVTNFGQMTPEQGYETQTMLTLVLGLSSMVGIFVLSLIL